MTNQIVEKINLQLKKSKFSEPLVVYILAGIRKIIEQESSSDEWDNLEFYCNWVLHYELDRKPARFIIQQFEPLYQRMKMREESDSPLEAENISKFIVFRKELSIFLKRFNILDFTTADEQWIEFKVAYANVISDCSLVIKNENQEGQIKKIVVNIESTEKDGVRIFKTNWNILPKAGLPAQFYVLDGIE